MGEVTKQPPIDIITAMEDENLFGPFFEEDSWDNWKVFLKAIYNIPLTKKEFELYQKCTGRERTPKEEPLELYTIAGRRSGKALSLDTEVPTVDGYKTIGDLREGDYVFGSDGEPTRVLCTHPVEYDRPCYELTFSDGGKVIADAEHEWQVLHKNQYHVITTKEVEKYYRNLHIISVPDLEQKFTNYNHVTDVKKVDSVPVRCITVGNEDGLFLITRNNIITHNSNITSFIAVFITIFTDFKVKKGTRVVLPLIAQDKKSARTLYSYIKTFLTEIELLNQLVVRETANEIEIMNGDNVISIEILTASHKSLRGAALCSCILDEAAFYSVSTENPEADKEILTAVRPGTATFYPQSKVFVISSPYAQTGVLWDAYKNYWANDDLQDQDRVFVWNAESKTMNPSLPEDLIRRELEKDYDKAAAEYLGRFRSTVGSPFTTETLNEVIVEGCYENRPRKDIQYVGFVDMSGGSTDASTLAIAHMDEKDETPVLDLIREIIPPFSPDEVVAEFTRELHRYGVYSVQGDKYGAAWVTERFERHGIEYIHSDYNRSELYLNLLPLVNSGNVKLLDHGKMFSQLVGLERKPTNSHKDKIDHPRGGHDDVANAVAGVIVMAAQDAMTDELEIW